MLTFFGYNKCNTCRKARRWLDDHQIVYAFVDITEHPPSQAVLHSILRTGDYRLKDLFNTTGQLYRQMDIKSQLPTLTDTDAVRLLAKHGKLCKRPIVTDGKRATVGFNEPRFADTWNS